MKAYPFLIHQDTSGERLHPLANWERIYDEAWLQELLRRHPSTLRIGWARRPLVSSRAIAFAAIIDDIGTVIPGKKWHRKIRYPWT